ncbi:hypothetical protein [Moorena sp. SIO4G3]|uniref:hypothetical protein n=1 Tax=Moorena sp. SIO4G3 TaxID=2607821 RepID=UPI00142B2C99|nr:hypothetical protein [Moorena sp. SIO4G3]NEO81286.1 hypothetical protein [Moorena sp. SIO4G3]
MSLIVGTRIHSGVDGYISELGKVENWCSQALEYADCIVIATDNQLFDKISQIVSVFGEQVLPLLINPWKGLAHPLNAIVCEATYLGGDKLLLQSLEVYILSTDVEILNYHLTSDTLVVGAKMISTHGGDAGVKFIDGMTSPWNTLALWNLSKLNITGFLGISSGLIKDVPGGMEEVTTISLLQQLYQNQAQAKLVRLSDLKWITTWKSQERQKYHQKKMLTKLLRAEKQLEHSRIQRGVVTILE